jgi:hypothetical protein
LQDLPILVTLKSQSRENTAEPVGDLRGPGNLTCKWAAVTRPVTKERKISDNRDTGLAEAGRITGIGPDISARQFSAWRLLRPG